MKKESFPRCFPILCSGISHSSLPLPTHIRFELDMAIATRTLNCLRNANNSTFGLRWPSYTHAAGTVLIGSNTAIREGGDHLSSFGGQAQSHGSRTEATKGQSPRHHQGQSPEPKRTAQKIRGVAPRLWTPSARSSAVGASHKSGDEPKAQEAEIENQNRKK